MHKKRSSLAFHLVAALVTCSLLLGCGVDGESSAEKDGGGAMIGEATATAAAGDPTPAPSAPLQPGQPWSTAQLYLDQLSFVGGAAGHEHWARVCDDCDYVNVRIRPEGKARGLKLGHFGSGQRVVAMIELRENKDAPPLGFNRSNTRRQSWLLTTSARRAVVMYDSAGTIAFSPAWNFEVRPESAEAGKQKARWLEIPHAHGLTALQDTGLVQHLTSAWVSCAEGCCNATYLQ